MRFIWIALLLPQLCFAEVLVDNVPNSGPAKILSAVKYAFVRRQWTLESSDETSVTASLKHNRAFMRMKVYLDGSQLKYAILEQKKIQLPRPPQNTFQGTESTDPRKWIKGIKRDVEQLLVLVTDDAGLPPARSSSR